MYGTESGEFTSNKTVYFIPVVKFHNPERINKIEKKGVSSCISSQVVSVAV